MNSLCNVIIAIFVISTLAFSLSLETHAEKVSYHTDDLRTSILNDISLPFIENQGQQDSVVKFYVNTFAGTVFVTDESLMYYVKGASEDDHTELAVKEFFVSSVPLKPIGLEKSKTKVNYFVGSQQNWRTDVPAYNTISLGEVFPNIEVYLKSHGNNIEKVFMVYPGGNVDSIKIGFEGIYTIKIGTDGELLIETKVGTFSMTKPTAFQEIDGFQKTVDVSYYLDGNEYGFEVGNYDSRYTLTIDPLIASTFVGDVKKEFASDIAVDASDNVYVTGWTLSETFPTTLDGYNPEYIRDTDAFVFKISNDLTTLLSSTFLGGGAPDFANGVVIDNSGNLFISGSTLSTDIPTTPGSYAVERSGGGSKISSSLNLVMILEHF